MLTLHCGRILLLSNAHRNTDDEGRDQIFNKVTKVFKLHGAETLDTPVFELREVLTGKYGEDSKLIYGERNLGGDFALFWI